MKTISVENLPVDAIKQEIKLSLNKKVEITEHNKQGKLIHRYNGIIESVHDNLFLVRVELNGYTLNKSFTYVDFSIGELKYSILEE